MAQKVKDQAFSLQPSWKHFFIPYFFSVLAIPIFGIGLVALYYVWKKHRAIIYKVTNTQISSVNEKFHRTVDLVNIEWVELEQNWLQEKLGVGTLVLHTPASEMRLIGMTTPERLVQIMEQAVEAEKERQRQRQRTKTKPKEPKYEPGSMDKMDYLTGLWQQGLISNEDYEKERKHFE